MENSKFQAILNTLISNPDAAKLVQKKIARKQRKLERAKLKITGHIETEISIPLDDINSDSELTTQEIFEQKSNEYADLLIENPQLKIEAEEYFAPEKVLNKRQLKYRAQISEAKTLALETLEALSGSKLDALGRRHRLTKFQSEVLKHLQDAADMGIEIPFLFNGNDPKLNALKTQVTLIKHEADLEEIDSKIESLSFEEQLSLQKVAAEVLSNLSKK